jgi:outer membrane lipoprotein SlyB
MAIAFSLAGIVAIVGWSLPEAGVADRRARTMALPNGISDSAGAPGQMMLATMSTQSRVNCAECGVIESMQRIDTHDRVMGGCNAGELARTRAAGTLFGDGEPDDAVSLADAVAGVIAGERAGRKAAVTIRHQIIVRFRDGSRHVFDESTPRTLHVGERIRVILASEG